MTISRWIKDLSATHAINILDQKSSSEYWLRLPSILNAQLKQSQQKKENSQAITKRIFLSIQLDLRVLFLLFPQGIMRKRGKKYRAASLFLKNLSAMTV